MKKSRKDCILKKCSLRIEDIRARLKELDTIRIGSQDCHEDRRNEMEIKEIIRETSHRPRGVEETTLKNIK